MNTACTPYVRCMYPNAPAQVCVYEHNKSKLADDSAVQQQLFSHQAQQAAVKFFCMPEDGNNQQESPGDARNMVVYMLGYVQKAW